VSAPASAHRWTASATTRASPATRCLVSSRSPGAAGCGGKSSNSSKSASAPAPAHSYSSASSSGAAAGGAGATVAVSRSKLGNILVDGSGRTLYLFEKDKGTTSSCNGACASGWPPYSTTGAPQAGSGASSSLLGTTARTDGTTQVAYHGHPLYYFAGDSKPGDANGEALAAFGAKWYALNPNGDKVNAG
jgi:predicted lipoprotein with Yx(FWY)xxD motif